MHRELLLHSRTLVALVASSENLKYKHITTLTARYDFIFQLKKPQFKASSNIQATMIHANFAKEIQVW